MQTSDFAYIAKLVESKSGIVLTPSKSYLIESRVEPIYKAAGFDSLHDFVFHLQWHKHGELHDQFIEAMTTNETSFFRDKIPFESLRKWAIADRMEERKHEKRLDIWCAACSTGQEPYSIGMILREHFPLLVDWDIRILATDLSSEALNKAKEGKYNNFDIGRGLPDHLKRRYFEPVGNYWHVKNSLKDLVEFKQLNFMDYWPSMPKMDIIFMRNVLIYFENSTKSDILRKASHVISPNGYIFLGQSENMASLNLPYESVSKDSASCYKLRSASFVRA